MKSNPHYVRTIALAAVLVLCLSGCQRPPTPGNTDAATEAPTEPFTVEPMTSAPDRPQTDLPSVEAGESVPMLSIVTEDGLPITSKTQYKTAVLSITGSENPFFDVEVSMSIRGRGHSSFKADVTQDEYNSKNSYRIKLDQAANLLGVGKTKDRDWVLISGKYDVSALRNYLVWDLAERMGTIPYVPSCTWVNVTINGDFRGMYTLVEQIEVENDRVDIDDGASADPDTVGYLIEYDLRGTNQAGAKEGLTYFYVPGLDTTYEWVIKSTVHSPQVTAAIQAHVVACHQAILSGDRDSMEAMVDMDSFLDMFILQELSKNPDAGTSSFYIQREPGGKLYLTAPWDFDFAFGTYSVAKSTKGLVADGQDVMSHPWFELLATQPWFMRLVLDRMEQIYPLMDATLQKIKGMEPKLKNAADQNDQRWNLYGEKFSIYSADDVSVRLKNYTQHVDFLIGWTRERWINLYGEVEKRAA